MYLARLQIIQKYNFNFVIVYLLSLKKVYEIDFSKIFLNLN